MCKTPDSLGGTKNPIQIFVFTLSMTPSPASHQIPRYPSARQKLGFKNFRPKMYNLFKFERDICPKMVYDHDSWGWRQEKWGPVILLLPNRLFVRQAGQPPSICRTPSQKLKASVQGMPTSLAIAFGGDRVDYINPDDIVYITFR